MNSYVLKKSRTLLFALMIVLVAVIALIALRTPPPPAAPLPNPNGYDDFRKAAALLAGDVGNATTLDLGGLRQLMATNAEPLQLLRLGLTRNCSMPTVAAATNFSLLSSELTGQKQLAQLLAAEGRLAELENRPADAAGSYMDVIRFGNEISRGGFILVRLVGIACEAIGLTPLARLAPNLDWPQQRALAAELEKADRTAVTWEEVMQAENKFRRHQLRHIHNPITVLTGWWYNRGANKRAEDKHNRVEARLRLLAVELALRCYRSEQGAAPARLDQLVPRYLQSVPLDPFSGQPLIYRVQGTNWLLYSVGVDRVDDGGTPAGRLRDKGDLFFDSPW